MAPPAPSGRLDNPLEPVAWVLFQLNQALNEAPSGRAPRWVRLARGRRIQSEGLGPALVAALGVVQDLIALLHELMLDLEELLVYLDPSRALAELILQAARAATAPDLGDALALLLEDPGVRTSLAEARAEVERVDQWVNFVPEPSDVRVIGGQLFQLLCVPSLPVPRRGGGVNADALPVMGPYVSGLIAGRLRILLWAFDRPVTVRGYGPHDAPESRTVAIRRLGVRPLWLEGAAAWPRRARDEWPLGPGAPPVELYDVRFEGEHASADLHELHAALEALGYTAPAIPAGTQDFSPALAARLEVFQALNDLPRGGELDLHTLHRLLHLDWQSRNIARARPFDPRRFRARPKPLPTRRTERVTITVGVEIDVPRPGDLRLSGMLPLINPGADEPQDEQITPTQEARNAKRGVGQHRTEIRPWYLCGTRRQDFTGPVGWIQHSEEPDPWNPGRTLLGQFVAIGSRPRVPGENHHEGSTWSEGAAALGGSFFAARETEPWMSGRYGIPVAGRLHPNPDLPTGWVSGMYQWVDIQECVRSTPPAHRLVLEATACRRSLFKEGAGVGGVPDQGALVLTLARRSQWERQRYRTVLDLSTMRPPRESAAQPTLLEGESGWWPTRPIYTGFSRLKLLALATDWRLQRTQPLIVPTGEAGDPVVAVAVGLYGRGSVNHDIDAYFDNVQIRWTYEPIAGGHDG